MQQMQEVSANGVVIRRYLYFLLMLAVVVPVANHRAQARNQAVGDVTSALVALHTSFVIDSKQQRLSDKRIGLAEQGNCDRSVYGLTSHGMSTWKESS